jgi:hypothetical protein
VRKSLPSATVPDLFREKGDGFVGRFERAVVGPLAGFSQAGVNRAALGWSVLVIGIWKFRDDVDDSARYLELHPGTGFYARLAARATGHNQVIFGFDSDGHDGITIFDYDCLQCKVIPRLGQIGVLSHVR